MQQGKFSQGKGRKTCYDSSIEPCVPASVTEAWATMCVSICQKNVYVKEKMCMRAAVDELNFFAFEMAPKITQTSQIHPSAMKSEEFTWWKHQGTFGLLLTEAKCSIQSKLNESRFLRNRSGSPFGEHVCVGRQPRKKSYEKRIYTRFCASFLPLVTFRIDRSTSSSQRVPVTFVTTSTFTAQSPLIGKLNDNLFVGLFIFFICSQREKPSVTRIILWTLISLNAWIISIDSVQLYR